MDTREELLDEVKRILVGPNPLPGYTQDNGEEILFTDSPLRTYVTGVLFPFQSKIKDSEQEIAEDSLEENESTFIDETIGIKEHFVSDKNIAEPAIEAETSKINNYRQSAMGITLCVDNSITTMSVDVSVGRYERKRTFYPKETKDKNGKQVVIKSDLERWGYFRKSVNTKLVLTISDLPGKAKRYKEFELRDDSGEQIKGLAIHITYRLSSSDGNYTIFTVTLVNKNSIQSENIAVEDCWFQCEFSVKTDKVMCALPGTFCAEITDEDYKLNSLLYRNVKTYAIGHGCAATWDPVSIPNKIVASVMPVYDVKPIIPTASAAQMSMQLYATDKDATILDLLVLCEEYKNWIQNEEKKIITLNDPVFIETATNQIKLCKQCLSRMENGIELIKSDNQVLMAFQLANRAMLMQQLHYKLPLTEFADYNVKDLYFELKNSIVMPDFNDEKTWYNKEQNVYGKWRPFQIAFILMNLSSICDRASPERAIVDLIWFPTGGGKTEAYLGLTAFTIFMRRIRRTGDYGTTVIMRYTLRLLTAQQYERAASLVCAMEKLRSQNEELLGKERITIGLWVGDSLTKNDSKDVIKKINEIKKGKSSDNVSVILKCPWCGASMETFKTVNGTYTPGYEISHDKKHVEFRCANDDCDFSQEGFGLPLNLFDDEIYLNPPTLLFGTVDKFAMLPYRPEAKSLFGGDNERTPPELIIQDELHLITGPLGSSVGLYETLIHELCVRNGGKPKIVASTATISHAKQQCNALYGCGEDKVFQFPVQGITYSDCFFAKEDVNAVGRKYVGLYGSAASSSATASIYTFAAFMYAAKSIEVVNEKDRDPYWTNLAYFSSMRELGQAATWYIADVKERLEVIYHDRLKTMVSNDERRYVYESGLAELTSRMSNDEIPKILKSLEIPYGSGEKKPLDMCLATNMISVGVDISRLGLMTVTGQPKSMSEYIQATSRVGRDAKNAPGLVFIIYNTSKSRDKSVYEKFQSQHSKLYYNVEPTSVTPFSRPLRERALHAIFVALHRFFIEPENRNNARRVPTEAEFRKIVDVIVDRAKGIDLDEVEDIKKQLNLKWREWKGWAPEKFHSFTIEETAPLLCPAGTIKPPEWDNRGWDTPTSMRSVDRECGLTCSKILNIDSEDTYV